MSKLRILYIVSLVILGLLVVFTAFRPIVSSRKYSEVSGESIIQAKDEWIIQFDIINREGRDTSYTMNVSVAGEQFSEQFMIQNGGVYTYIHHVLRRTVGIGEVTIAIYKEGEDTPFEQGTYHLT